MSKIWGVQCEEIRPGSLKQSTSEEDREGVWCQTEKTATV